MATARRGRGEGSITRRRDGRWQATLDLGWSQGRRRRRVIYGQTRQDALDRLRVSIRELDAGSLVDTEVPTLAAFLNRWLDGLKPTVRHSTSVRYEGLCRVHLIPELGRIRLNKLTTERIDRFLADRLAAGSAPRTVHHMRAVLRAALTASMRWGMLARNPVTFTRPIRVPQADAGWLTQDEARRLLDAARGERLAALLTVALGLGLRQGEILGLRWSDVDLHGGHLTVNHTLQWLAADAGHPKRWVLGEPKSKLSRRTLPLPSSVSSALHEHHARQLEDRLLAGGDWAEFDLVFATEVGTPLDGDRVRHAFREVLAGAGLDAVTFHQLRHSAASLLIAQGVPLKVISDVLGHSTIALTANTYGHLSEELWHGAADAMDRALGQQAGT